MAETSRTVRARASAPLTLGLLVLVACFEDPVEERLSVRFRSDGCYEITSSVEIANDPGGGGNEALARRLEETRRLYEGQGDAWTRRFEALGASWDRLVLERGSGRLARVERSASACNPDGMSRFFADAGLAASVRIASGEAVFEIFPGRPSRASRAQRDRVAETLGAWSEAVAGYLVAVDRLYVHLAGRPESVRPCLAVLYREHLADEAVESAGAPDEEGARLVDGVRDGRATVLEVFDVPEGEAYGLNELSLLVFDPFPAPLSVTVAGEVLEVEGFERSGDGTLRAGGFGFVAALEGLEGRWIAPDPLFTHLRAMREVPDGHLDLNILATAERRSSAPSAREVEEALKARLSPARVYRVRWAPSGEDGPAPRADSSS
ncbi:MAG: hypothetical protein ACOY3Y_13165 [Acidobacteriota bacterium]